jgi:hypothetical protein
MALRLSRLRLLAENIMCETVNTDSTMLMFRIIGPLFLIGFALFTEFVAKGLPPQGFPGWKLIRIGGFVLIFGLIVVAYFSVIEVGSAVFRVVFGVGCLLWFIGMIKLFVGWIAYSFGKKK